MLNAMNTKGIKRLSVITAAILSIGITSTQTFAGDGRNGPQTSGNAIPVQVDRALTVTDLVAVSYACDFKLINKLYTQIFKVENPSLAVYAQSFYVEPDAGNKKQLLTDTAAGNHELPSQNVVVRYLDGSGEIIIFAPQGEVGLRRADETITERTVRPRFVFDEEISESSYDELGRLVMNRVLVKNPIIALPNTGLKPIKGFINMTTGKIAPVEVNVEEYAKCLLSGVQKKD